MKKNSLSSFILECLGVFALFLAAIVCLDASRMFAYDNLNNHTEKRWHYLRKMKGSESVDVLLLGNSHTYCGIAPKYMTTYLGCNCFIIGSNGIYAPDAYYTLKEALKYCSPKVLVIETYPFQGLEQKKLAGGDLTCQMQSFEPRPMSFEKVLSTFKLFSLDTAPYGWSKTLRNHSYVFDNPAQISRNVTRPKKIFRDKYYLGQFARFTSGLTQKTLDRYMSEGSPVDGSAQKIGKDSEKALKKIMALCKLRGIKVMFMTIPMYYEHVKNFDVWQNELNRVFGAYYDVPWLNFQKDYALYGFSDIDFEDTYGVNQHMTIHGSIICSGALSSFLKSNFNCLPDRSSDPEWRKVFSDDYFFYFDQSPAQGELGKPIPVASIGSLKAKEAVYVNKQKSHNMILKMDPASFPDPRILPSSLTTGIAFRKSDGSIDFSHLDFIAEPYFQRTDYAVYNAEVKDGYDIVSIILQ